MFFGINSNDFAKVWTLVIVEQSRQYLREIEGQPWGVAVAPIVLLAF